MNTGHANTNSRTPAPRRVLVVDDNVDGADSLATLLQLLGHDVATAYSGANGLAVAEAFRPDAVFLDIGMPGMNGYEVAKRLRAGPNSTEIRLLVAVSGYGTTSDHHRAREAGFDRLLLKPADPDLLVGLLT